MTTAPTRPRWCHECDEATRMVDLPDGRVGHCPNCSPRMGYAAAVAASDRAWRERYGYPPPQTTITEEEL